MQAVRAYCISDITSCDMLLLCLSIELLACISICLEVNSLVAMQRDRAHDRADSNVDAFRYEVIRAADEQNASLSRGISGVNDPAPVS